LKNLKIKSTFSLINKLVPKIEFDYLSKTIKTYKGEKR
jgi:hypothetical protein